MPRQITRRDLLTKAIPTATALGGSGLIFAGDARAAFYHGVASGDPTQSQVIIWTRVTTSHGVLEVQWELASDADFNQIVHKGIVKTDATRDFTVKVDVEELLAGSDYFYRFKALDVISAVGRTRTLPAGKVNTFKMAVCSCANYPSGYFNAYAAMAELDDLDLVIHLGDYIYEYDADGYASSGAEALGRVSEPMRELTRLGDFRRRHGQYKSDASLQALHAKHPFILSWDDHEVANDSWRSGAENHDDGEGDWHQRKAAALQAYYEWMPIRPPAGRDLVERWRNFDIGDLASLTMLETRLSARDEQIEVSHHMVFVSAKFDLSDPSRPQQVANDVSGEDIEEVNLPFDFNQSEPTPVLDYGRIKELQSLEKWPAGFAYMPDVKRFYSERLADPNRQLLGQQQREFVSQALKASTAAAKPWQIMGNQTLVAEVMTPNLAAALNEDEKQKLAEWVKPGLEWTRFGLPFGTDSWNGYIAEREWFLNEAAKSESNLVVLTGDTHAAWAFELAPKTENSEEDEQQWQGVELGVTSVSSPGLPEALGTSAERLSELMLETNPNLRYSEPKHRGFMTLELTPEQANAEFHQISTVTERKFTLIGKDRFSIRPSKKLSGLEIEST